jgi:hypothetical protein
MTTDQLARVPEHTLRRSSRGCAELIAWLRARGWQMSLLEIEQERARRGIASGRR